MRTFLFLLMLVAATSAMAQTADPLAASKDMYSCAVFMEKAAELAHEDGPSEQSKQTQSMAAAYKMAAIAYMPPDIEPSVARSHIEQWTDETNASTGSIIVNEVAYSTFIAKCDSYTEQVQAVVKAYNEPEAQN